ncbi:helix-turn-helix domain-containing protein [Taklimakanibacter lacteus]|uniref:helix-turn-helix domain-containing protein n=1 Tax=Taklimakanibacter lacteus TaxID=2268456 RepID=UPI000E66DE9F
MSMQLEIRRYRGGDRHSHDYSQILFPMQGSMRLAMEGRCGTVASHCVAIVPERCEHDFEPSMDCSLMVLDVETSALSDDLRPDILRQEIPIVTRVDPFLWRLFSLLGAEVEADSGRAPDAARLALTGLQLVRPGSTALSQRPAEQRVLTAAHILAGGRETPAVAGMARQAGLGQSQFHALFRATTGQSPKQFHLRKLLDRAVDRLTTTSEPVSEIAYSLGYQNVSSFNRLFKKRFGATPTEFRAAGRNRPN